MSPIRGQSVKGALQYNSQLRNMSDTMFMRHLGWLETGTRDNQGGNKRSQAQAPPKQHYVATNVEGGYYYQAQQNQTPSQLQY